MTTRDVFFYGLFMDEAVLRAKGVNPLRPRKAVVPSRRLRIGRRALLVPQFGQQAFGMVFALTDREIESLYAEPGLELYRPESVMAIFEDGTFAAVTTFNLIEADASLDVDAEYATKLRGISSGWVFLLTRFHHRVKFVVPMPLWSALPVSDAARRRFTASARHGRCVAGVAPHSDEMVVSLV